MANSILITCKQATMMVVQNKEVKFSLKQRFALWLHLALCKFCKLFALQNEAIDMLLARKKSGELLTESEKEKLKENLKA